MTLRRGGRVVECTALEMRHTREGIVGSNPTLSASNPFHSISYHPKIVEISRFLLPLRL